MGGRIVNCWYKANWEAEAPLDAKLPPDSKYVMIAAFDDETHGNDLEAYLELTDVHLDRNNNTISLDNEEMST